MDDDLKAQAAINFVILDFRFSQFVFFSDYKIQNGDRKRDIKSQLSVGVLRVQICQYEFIAGHQSNLMILN